MVAKLTDKQKKQIIARRAEGESLRGLAKRFGVSDATIRRVLRSDPKTSQKVAQKKAQNTADVLAHMDGQKEAVCGLLDAYLAALGDPEKIARAGLSQLATTMGILIDKYTATVQNEQALRKLDEMLEKIGGVI